MAKLEALAASSLEGYNHSNRDTSTSPLSSAPQLSEPQKQWLAPPSLELQIPTTSLKPPPIEVYSPDEAGMGNSVPFTIPTIDVTPSSRPHSPFWSSLASQGQRPFTPSSASSTESWSVPHSPAPSLLWPIDDCEHGQDSRSLFDFSLHANDHFVPSNQPSFASSPHQNSPPVGRLSSEDHNASRTTLGIPQEGAYSTEPYNLIDRAPSSEPPSIDDIVRDSIHKVASKPDEHLSSTLASVAKWPAAYEMQIMADRTHADSCANAYFNDIHPMYPFLDEATFHKLLDATYTREGMKAALPAGTTLPIATFQVYMVLAIGALVLKNQRGDSRVARDTYCLAAMRQIDAIQMWNSTSGIHCSLLLAVVCLYDGTLLKEVWTLKSNIVSACIELGLHRMPQGDIPADSWDALGIRTFLSAYYLDRTVGIGLDRPFSISEDDMEIESLIAFLRDGPHSSRDSSLLAVLTGVYQIISISRRMQRLLRSSPIRRTTYFLYDPSPSAAMNWRSQTFQNLELLRSEFLEIIQTPEDGVSESDNTNLGTLVEAIELKIHEAILTLFHPSEQTISPLTQPEIEHAISTARLSLVAYKRLWVSRKLLICTTTAKSVYLCGESLALLSMAEGGSGAENTSVEPEMGFCFDILGDFTEIEVAGELTGRLRRLVG